MADFILAVAKIDHQTAKFNSPPNFPAVRYECDFIHHSWFSNCDYYLYTVPRITIYNITVLESAGTVEIPINRTGGDLSRVSVIRATSRDVPGQAVGE